MHKPITYSNNELYSSSVFLSKRCIKNSMECKTLCYSRLKDNEI